MKKTNMKTKDNEYYENTTINCICPNTKIAMNKTCLHQNINCNCSYFIWLFNNTSIILSSNNKKILYDILIDKNKTTALLNIKHHSPYIRLAAYSTLNINNN